MEGGAKNRRRTKVYVFNRNETRKLLTHGLRSFRKVYFTSYLYRALAISTSGKVISLVCFNYRTRLISSH